VPEKNEPKSRFAQSGCAQPSISCLKQAAHERRFLHRCLERLDVHEPQRIAGLSEAKDCFPSAPLAEERLNLSMRHAGGILWLSARFVGLGSSSEDDGGQRGGSGGSGRSGRLVVGI
jgi:hypothetical protein